MFESLIASKFPIYITKNYRIKSLEGKISLPNDWDTGIIQFGMLEIGIYDKYSDKGIIDLKSKSEIKFLGQANFGVGCRLSMNESSLLEVGENFTITADNCIICCGEIKIGRECLFSWGNLIMDSNLHDIAPSSNKTDRITIGDKVWLGARCTILKGTKIPHNSIIGANSLLTGQYDEENTIIAGNPAKSIKKFDSWK